VTQGSQSLALGLALTAAPQLGSQSSAMRSLVSQVRLAAQVAVPGADSVACDAPVANPAFD